MQIKKALSANHVFYTLILTTVVIILINMGIIGNKQDQFFLQERNRINLAQKFFNEGNDLQGDKVLAELAADYPDNYHLQWNYGRYLAAKGDNAQALNYYKKVEELFPLIVREPSFLLDMGQCLYEAKDFSQAAKYMQIVRLNALSTSGDREMADKLLSAISKEMSDE